MDYTEKYRRLHRKTEITQEHREKQRMMVVQELYLYEKQHCTIIKKGTVCRIASETVPFFNSNTGLNANTVMLFYLCDGDNFCITVSSINCNGDFVSTFNCNRDVATKVGYVSGAVVHIHIAKT